MLTFYCSHVDAIIQKSFYLLLSNKSELSLSHHQFLNELNLKELRMSSEILSTMYLFSPSSWISLLVGIFSIDDIFSFVNQIFSYGKVRDRTCVWSIWVAYHPFKPPPAQPMDEIGWLYIICGSTRISFFRPEPTICPPLSETCELIYIVCWPTILLCLC